MAADPEDKAPAPTAPGGWRLQTFARGDAHRDAARRVRDWARARFSLGPEDTLTANEISCELPGCPPLETVIAFWTEGGTKRHHLKIFKPITEVTEDDLPPGWMRPALEVDENFYCSCC